MQQKIQKEVTFTAHDILRALRESGWDIPLKPALVPTLSEGLTVRWSSSEDFIRSVAEIGK